MIDSLFWIKTSMTIGVMLLFIFAIFLWVKVPELFDYFNQAFCAH